MSSEQILIAAGYTYKKPSCSCSKPYWIKDNKKVYLQGNKFKINGVVKPISELETNI